MFKLISQRSKFQTIGKNWYRNIEVIEPYFYAKNFVENEEGIYINPTRVPEEHFNFDNAELLLFPIHISSRKHFFLLAADLSKNIIMHFDSLPFPEVSANHRMKVFGETLNDYLTQKRTFQTSVQQVPIQTLNDCGIMCIVNAERLSRKVGFDYSLSIGAVEFIRLQIGINILRFDPNNIEIIVPKAKRIDPIDFLLLEATQEVTTSKSDNNRVNDSRCETSATTPTTMTHSETNINQIKVEKILCHFRNLINNKINENTNEDGATLLFARELTILIAISTSSNNKRIKQILELGFLYRLQFD